VTPKKVTPRRNCRILFVFFEKPSPAANKPVLISTRDWLFPQSFQRYAKDEKTSCPSLFHPSLNPFFRFLDNPPTTFFVFFCESAKSHSPQETGDFPSNSFSSSFLFHERRLDAPPGPDEAHDGPGRALARTDNPNHFHGLAGTCGYIGRTALAEGLKALRSLANPLSPSIRVIESCRHAGSRKPFN